MLIDIPTVEGGEFIDGGPNNLGTIVRAKFLNSLMKSSVATTEEIQTILMKNGIKPDQREHDQLFKAINKMIQDANTIPTEGAKVVDSFGESRTEAGSQRTINVVKKKADQVPDPKENQIVIGKDGKEYRLISIEDLTKLINYAETTGDRGDIAMSQKAMTESMMGFNQSYKTVTGQRKKGINYVNTTKAPIFVTIYRTVSESGGHIYVDDLQAGYFTTNAGGYSHSLSVSFIVPPGSMYRCESIFTEWWELTNE